MITAEQVHDAIFNGSTYASYDGVMYYANGIHMQEIADELNATLDTGTCRWEYPQGTNGWLGYMVCSGCGEKFDECVTDTAHYCPNCGRKVVEE